MKKILSLLIILGISLSGCEDFLDATPETFFTPSNFFQTEEHINRAVIGIYNQNRALHNRLQWIFGEFRSDNSTFFYNPSDRGGFQTEAVDEFVMTADNSELSSYWNTVYTGISRCNYVLEMIDKISFTNQANRERRRAEALFFRAWFYFNLLRLFGDVPYITNTFSTSGEALSSTYTARRATSDIYQNIHADIQLSIDKLPVKWDGEPGRTTKGAALMLKAKMFMAQGQFAEAIPLLEQLSGLGYELLKNYKDVFDPAYKNHKESIFEIQYSFDVGQSSNFLSSFVPWNSGTSILGLGQTAGSRGGLNQPTRELIKLYRAGDKRKEATVANFIVLNNVAIDSDNDTIPYLGKYAFPFKDVGEQDVNWPMFRYADAMLMLAECYATVSAGVDQNAIGLVNLIRLRAGVPPLSDVSTDPELVVSSREELLKAIERERRLELAFENHRWFDLLRYGTAVEVITSHGLAQKAEKTTVLPEAYTNIRTLLGIPSLQVIQFGTEQTPGW
jgi:hypothetical protein